MLTMFWTLRIERYLGNKSSETFYRVNGDGLNWRDSNLFMVVSLSDFPPPYRYHGTLLVLDVMKKLVEKNIIIMRLRSKICIWRRWLIESISIKFCWTFYEWIQKYVDNEWWWDSLFSSLKVQWMDFDLFFFNILTSENKLVKVCCAFQHWKFSKQEKTFILCGKSRLNFSVYHCKSKNDLFDFWPSFGFFFKFSLSSIFKVLSPDFSIITF